jgi:hypothetical protein
VSAREYLQVKSWVHNTCRLIVPPPGQTPEPPPYASPLPPPRRPLPPSGQNPSQSLYGPLTRHSPKVGVPGRSLGPSRSSGTTVPEAISATKLSGGASLAGGFATAGGGALAEAFATQPAAARPLALAWQAVRPLRGPAGSLDAPQPMVHAWVLWAHALRVGL